jgi:hypothetical protein
VAATPRSQFRFQPYSGVETSELRHPAPKRRPQKPLGPNRSEQLSEKIFEVDVSPVGRTDVFNQSIVAEFQAHVSVRGEVNLEPGAASRLITSKTYLGVHEFGKRAVSDRRSSRGQSMP